MALPHDTKQGIGLSLGIDWSDILRSASRFKWVALLVIVSFTTAAGMGTLQMPKTYEATAKLLMEPVVPKILGNDPGVQELSDQFKRERAFFNTQYKIITSRPVVLRAVEQLGLRQDAEYLRQQELSSQAPDRTLEAAVARAIEVKPDRSTHIVEVAVQDGDPERAARIANAITQAYIDYTLDRRIESARNASRWLDDRVGELSATLKQKEEELHEFRKSNVLVSVSLEDRRNMTSASLARLNEQLLDVKTRLIEREAFRRTLNESSSDLAQSLEGESSSHGDIIKKLREALVDLKRQRAELSPRYKTKHPKMLAIERQISETEDAVEREWNLYRESVDKTIEALRTNMASLKAEIEEEKQNALALNSLTLGYTSLTRDIGTTREIYENLLRRQTETNLSQLLESNFVQWYQRAEPRHRPVSPSIIQNSLLGFAAALLLSVLSIVVMSILDHSVHSRADIEGGLGLPFLGVFPRLPNQESSSEGEHAAKDLYVLKNPQTMAAECARSIRTNLLFMGTSHPTRRLLVTSPRSGEGKTTTTVAVGVAMAQAGNRVLLVDADLRRPQLHRAFGISRAKGLTNMLVDQDSPNYVFSTEVAGLDLLPSGPIPPNPAELLQSESFSELLTRITKDYDRVLIDSPPLGVVVDASILSKVTDGTIVVTMADRTPKDALRKALSRLHDVQAHIVGVILNYVEARASSYEYAGYYTQPETEADPAPIR